MFMLKIITSLLLLEQLFKLNCVSINGHIICAYQWMGVSMYVNLWAYVSMSIEGCMCACQRMSVCLYMCVCQWMGVCVYMSIDGRMCIYARMSMDGRMCVHVN